MRADVRGKPSGFTLIELLVVIGILAGLAAILIPVISSARRTAKFAACKHLLSQLECALDRYNEDFGCYVPDRAVGGKPHGDYSAAACLYYFLATPDLSHHHPYIELQPEEQCRDTDDGDPEDDIVIDPWGQPLHYDSSVPEEDNPPPQHNVYTYDLWSDGSPTLDERNHKTINNWE